MTVASIVDRYLKQAKAPTYLEARAELFKYLEDKGWKVNSTLKIPHATSPDGDVRMWFKTQAVWVSYGDAHGRHDFKNARSIHGDIRRMKPEEVIADAKHTADFLRKRDEDR